jgi:thiosulfate dehydrogenase [quinone] large subunit
MNPFADTLAFLTRNEWPIYVFWLLLLGSLGIAVVNLLQDPAQRMGRHVWMWVARLLIGGLWWQQTLWKLPPTYTDSPDGVSGGLHYWVGEMVQHSAFGIQSWLVEKVIQPHFYFFAPQVYAAEVIIAVSLLLGVFTRLGGVLGALMAMNLWLGLYRASYEWPWTYFFLILLQATFAVLHAGRSLGLDAILARREQAQPKPEGAAARVLAYLT